MGEDRNLSARLGASIAFLLVTVVLALLNAAAATHGLVVAVAQYKPIILDTRPETLFVSAFYEPHLLMVGPATLFTAVLFVPYAVVRGFGRAVVVFFAGHLLATIAVVLVVVPMDAAGARWAVHIVHTSDVGASAGLAACAGAMATYVTRRIWPLGVPVLLALYAFFAHGALYTHGLDRLSDVEHLIALTLGVVLEARWPEIRERAATAWSRVQRSVVPHRWAGADPAPL